MQYASLVLRSLDFASVSISPSLLPCYFSRSLHMPISLFLSSYPVERARYPFRADIPWRIPGTKAATIPREYVGQTRNVKRVRSFSLSFSSPLPLFCTCLADLSAFPSIYLSLPLDLSVSHSLSLLIHRIRSSSPAISLFLPLLFLSSLS